MLIHLRQESVCLSPSYQGKSPTVACRCTVVAFEPGECGGVQVMPIIVAVLIESLHDEMVAGRTRVKDSMYHNSNRREIEREWRKV